MPIEVTARHIRASGELQGYATGKAQELVEAFPKVEHIHVILDRQKRQYVAEMVVQAKNHQRVEAAESSDNLRLAIDQAAAKVEKQLRRRREKVHNHKMTMKRGEAARKVKPAAEEQ